MNESYAEKTRTILATPFRWIGGLAMERLPLNPSGRYERHMVELRRRLRTIPTHHSEHHLLRGFISDIPRSLVHPPVEEHKVKILDSLTLEANGHSDSVELITGALYTETLDTAAVLRKADMAASFKTDAAGSVYRYVAANGAEAVGARTESEAGNQGVAAGVKELVLPTTISGIVMGFSGLAVSKLNDVQGSALEIRFYSVPPEVS